MSDVKTAPFYPGIVSEVDQNAIRSSEMWPVVLALHYNTGGKLYVTEVTQQFIYFRTKSGAHIATIKKDKVNGEMSVHLSSDKLQRNSQRTNLVFSTNAKYLVGKLKPDNSNIESIVKCADHYDKQILPDVLSRLTSNFSSTYREPGTEARVEMQSEFQEYALRVLFNADSVDPDREKARILAEYYQKILESDEKKARYKKKYGEMFTPTKHLIIFIKGRDYYPKELFITGQLNTLSRTEDHEIKCNMTQELHMVNDLQTDPELMASLVYWKIMRESYKGPKIMCYDKEELLPAMHRHIDFEAGSMVGNSSDSNAYAIFLIHKTGEQGA
jgi:hypothetical protein